jgi:hypothetical protein
MIDLLIGFVLLVAAFVPIVIIGRWILGPIDRAARSREAPVRFSIGDFLCLFLAVQIPLTLIYQFVGEDERPVYWLFTIITWIIAPVIWFACAQSLSKAGVSASKHRLLFLGLIMPIVYYALVPFVFITVVSIGSLAAGEPVDLGNTGWLVAAWLALVGVFFLSGLFTRWMVRHAQPTAPIRPHEPEPASEAPLSELQRRLANARAAVNRHAQSAAGATMPDSGNNEASGQPSHLGVDRLQ